MDHSSSDDASIDTSSSSSSSIGASSSSLSSSRRRLTPCGPSSSGFTLFADADGKLADVVEVEVTLFVDDGGALKIDCCSSEEAIVVGATTGGRYTPSNFVKISDLPLAYWIFYERIRKIVIRTISEQHTISFPKKSNPCRALIA